MNKKLLLSLGCSLAIHLLLFIGLRNIDFQPKLNFSVKQGESQIRASIEIYERQTEQVVKENKASIGQKKSKKIQKKLRPSKSAKGQQDRGKNSILAKYLASIRVVVAEHKVKTRMAKKLNMTGQVKVGFSISAPNIMENLHIIEKSKHIQLDDSALRTVKSVPSFPSIPGELERAEIPVVLVIIYK